MGGRGPVGLTMGMIFWAGLSGLVTVLTGPWWGARKPLSGRVRLMTGLFTVLVILFGRLINPAWSSVYDGLVVLWVVAAWVDIRERIIPNRIVVLTLVWSVLFISVGWRSVLTGGCLFLFYLAINLISRGGLGMGDVKLSGVIGFALGWPQGLLATVSGIWVAGFYALFLVLFKRKNRQDSIALGPFLAFGGIIGLLDLIH